MMTTLFKPYVFAAGIYHRVQR